MIRYLSQQPENMRRLCHGAFTSDHLPKKLAELFFQRAEGDYVVTTVNSHLAQLQQIEPELRIGNIYYTVGDACDAESGAVEVPYVIYTDLI